MFSAKSWIPVLAGMAIIVGCDTKAVDKVPTTPPMAMKEPFEVLRNLQYMAVRKDMKHAAVILVSDPDLMYNSAWWFNKHAGELGLSLTAEEIKALDVTELNDMGFLAPGVSKKELQEATDKVAAKVLPALPANMNGFDTNRLDLLPTNAKDKEFETIKAKYVRHALAAGLYRLSKAIPDAMWPEITVIEIKPDPNDPKIHQVYLGYQGETLVQVAVKEKSDKTLGITYVYFKKYTPRMIKALWDKNHPAK